MRDIEHRRPSQDIFLKKEQDAGTSCPPPLLRLSGRLRLRQRATSNAFGRLAVATITQHGRCLFGNASTRLFTIGHVVSPLFSPDRLIMPYIG